MELYQFKIPDSWDRVVSIDPHLRKPHAVLWGAIANSRINGCHINDWFIYRECLVEGTMDDLEVAIKVSQGNERIKAYIGDPSLNVETDNFGGMDVFGELRSRGINVQPANKDVSGGLQRIRVMFESVPPRLYIFSSCPTLIYQIKHYRFKGTPVAGADYSEKVIKRDDDLVDCLRYMVNTGFKSRRRRRDIDEVVYSPVTGRPLGRRVA